MGAGQGTNALQPAVALAAQLIDLAIQTPDRVQRLVNGRSELGPLALPPVDALHLGGPAPHLRVDLLAELALRLDRHRLHDELHAARFANAVLLGAVLAEMAPLPIATGKTVLIEEAHVSTVQELGLAGVWLGQPHGSFVWMRGPLDIPWVGGYGRWAFPIGPAMVGLGWISLRGHIDMEPST